MNINHKQKNQKSIYQQRAQKLQLARDESLTQSMWKFMKGLGRTLIFGSNTSLCNIDVLGLIESTL